MNRNLAEMVRLRISSITSYIAHRTWRPIPFLLLAMLALLAPTAEAQVQFGGFPIAIGSPGNPWNGPVGVASDTSGNIYVAQFNGQTVVKIDATTHATSVFLSEACGGGFNGIQEIATDASNNLYVADTYRDQLEVYSIATATCTASYPVYGGFGVAVDSHGDIWVTATEGTSIARIRAGSPSGTVPTPVITSGLGSATGLAFDSAGNLYAADNPNNTVWKYQPPYTTQTALLNSSLEVGYAYGLYFDKQDDLYVCSSTSNKVLRYSASTNYATYVTEVSDVNFPEGVTGDPNGNIYVTGFRGSMVTEIPASGGYFGQVQVGSSNTITLNVEVVAGTTVGSFKVLDKGGMNLQFNEQSPDINANLCATGATPYGSTTTCQINLVFTPQFPGQQIGAVEALDSSGNILATAYLSGIGLAPLAGISPGAASVLGVSGADTLSRPAQPAIDSQGNLYLADFGNNRILKIAPGGAATVVATTGYSLLQPTGVALDGAGNLYIADGNNQRVLEIAANGTASQLTNGALTFNPGGIAVDAAGDVYVSDEMGNRLIEFPQGGAAQVLPITGLTQNLSAPTGVAVDGAGNLFVADGGNNRIVKVASSGTGSVVSLGGLSLNGPYSVAVDGVGNLYVSDSLNNRIVQIPATASADPAVALNTGNLNLSAPAGTAVSGNGELYIMDTGNNRIVTIAQAPTSSLSFTNTAQGSTSSDSPKTATLLNLGNEVLTIASATFATSTPNAGTSFTNDATTTCGTSLAANSSCIYSVDFAPAAVGMNASTLTLTDNTLNVIGSTQTIFLTGTGINPAPTVTAISPSSGGSTGGSTVTITGTGFTNASTVQFGATAASFTVVSSTSITAAAPIGTGTVDVTVTVNGITSATSAADKYSYLTATTVVPSVALTQNTAIASSITPVMATGGVGTLSYTISPNLPPGLSFSQTTGAITGKPTSSSASATYTVTATDANGATASSTFVLTVASPVTASTVAFFSLVQFPYDISPSPFVPVKASGGTGSLTYTISPALPTGLTIDSGNGAITGTVIQATPTITYTVTATDANGSSASSTFQMNVKAPAITVEPQSLPAAALGTYYNQTITAKGGTSPYTFSLTSGGLPPGLMLTTAGILSGTPSAAGSYNITINAADSSPGSGPYSGTGLFNLVVNPGVPGLAFAAGTSSATYTYGQPATLKVTSASPAPVIYSVTGPATLSASSGSPSLPTINFTGAGPVTVSATQAATTNYQSASTQVTLQAGLQPSVTLFTPPSVTSLPQGQPITFTATVTSAYGVGSPTGTITFLGNGYPLGAAVSVVNGSAQFTYSGAPLAAGTYTLMAQYSGDTNFLSSSSTLTNAVTVTPYSFTLTLPTSGSGSGSGSGGTPATVALPGQPANLSLQLVPTQGNTFQAPITFTLTGLPQGATYSLNPSTIAAGSGPTQVVVTINLPLADARNLQNGHRFNLDARSLIALALLLPLAGFTGLRRGRRMLRNTTTRMLLLIIATTALASLGGCASGGGFFNTPPHSYTITVTATSGSLTANMNFQLEVQ